ncbi:MAG TPA: protein kinase [Polyangiales bacterium]|nr:protein kinase [Polyangiales bacterium]
MVGPGSRLVGGRYLRLQQLGSGGMGRVYRALDRTSQREVALKQLQTSGLPPGRRKLVEALFSREYHTLARLRHPRIIDVYEYGVDSDGPYYTMELLSGSDLQELAPLPYREVCRHLRDVASSLALLHAHGLVHRDVSPRNVRLTEDGRTKLIDFGALAPFGVATSVVGTPICIAPETLRRMPLDQRTDLFGFGVVAYFALTGKAPYPARKIEELAELWTKVPPPPSQYASDVPPALDALIASLLSPDPLARPSSAAAVIDALTLIGELPSDEQQAAQSYLLSSALVGREREQTWFRKRLDRVREGKGALVLMTGAPGVGKTRLLHELALDGQLEGLVTVKADGQATPEPFGVAVLLGVELLRANPDLAQRAASPYAALLGQLSDGLRERLGESQPVNIAFDPSERRARYLEALHEWFVAVARDQPILVAVDNAQAVDSNSAAFLAALAHASTEQPILLLLTQRTGDSVSALEQMRALRRHANQLKLGALTLLDCEALTGSLFGDVPNRLRMAHLLYERSGGNPRYCLDLAELLVRRGIAKYAAGTWVLPQDVAEDELPSRVEDVVASRLSELTGAARDLVETLSVDGSPVAVDRCEALSPGRTPAEVYEALDELVAEQILIVDGERYQFRQESLRTAVLAQMEESRRRERHLQIADDLLARDPPYSTRVEAAWHLVRGGHETRGADLIVRSGVDYMTDQHAYDSTPQVVAALQKALEIYERQGRSKYEIASVMHALVPLGFFSSWRIMRDHSERGLALCLETTGLSRAQKLSKIIGKKAGLALALGSAHLRIERERKKGLAYDLKTGIRRTCGIAPGAIGMGAVSFDGAAIERMADMLAPLELLGKPDQIPNLMFRFVMAQVLLSQDRIEEANRALTELAPYFRRPDIVKAVGDGQSRGMYGGVIYTLAIVCCFQFGARPLELAAEMQTLRISVWEASAEQVRVLYHANRGESEDVQRCRVRFDLFATRGDSTWQSEIFFPAVLMDADLLVRDTVAARRNAEQLARRAAHIPSLQRYARVAMAGYLSLRGDLSGAIQMFEEDLPSFKPRTCVGWLTLRAHFADALNRAGRHARAKQLLIDALAQADPFDARTVQRTLEPQRQLALAEAGLGEHAAAVERLDALLTKHGHDDNRLLIGLLHKARAEVALAMRDEAALTRHFKQMEERFRSTRNPALIAQVERFAARVLRSRMNVPVEGRAAAARSLLPKTFADLTSAADRYKYALQLLVERAHAKAGFLYMLQDDGLKLVAATSPDEPPIGFETELRAWAQDARDSRAPKFELAEEDGFETQLVDMAQAPLIAPDYSIVMLTMRRDDLPVVVGGVILEAGERAELGSTFLEDVAVALHDRAMVSTAF